MYWDLSANNQKATAVIDESGNAISYASLMAKVDAAAADLRSNGTRQLGFIIASNTLSSLVAYLACLKARHVPLLLPSGISPKLLQSLQNLYQPDWLMGWHIAGEPLAGSDLPIVHTRSKNSLIQALALN